MASWSTGTLRVVLDNSNAISGEQVDTLATTPSLRVERIISHGQVSPPGHWYDQEEDEFVLLISGAARLEFSDGTVLELQPEDWVNIPAHVRHRVAWTDAQGITLWLAIFSPSVAAVKSLAPAAD